MIVIGTTAYPGSGQDFIADEICKMLDFRKYSMGDLIRQIASSKGIIPTRENLQDIRREYDTRLGRNFFSLILSDMIIQANSNAIVTGIRRKEELQIFRDRLNIYLIHVVADDEVRLKRIIHRSEAKDPKTYADFPQQEKAEGQLFDMPYLIEQSDYRLDCNKERAFYEQNLSQIIMDIPILKDYLRHLKGDTL